jgi:asparaginyl-tRNA synthetase
MLDSSHQFTKSPSYSDDLSSEHEHWLTKHFGRPVFVTQFPEKIKSFYMPIIGKFTSPDGDEIEYVDCFDLLVPDVGELVGGSARISDYDKLSERIKERGMQEEPLKFYKELRRLGSTPHGGMGLGFERLIQLLCGGFSDEIGVKARDVIPYPRFYGCDL